MAVPSFHFCQPELNLFITFNIRYFSPTSAEAEDAAAAAAAAAAG